MFCPIAGDNILYVYIILYSSNSVMTLGKCITIMSKSSIQPIKILPIKGITVFRSLSSVLRAKRIVGNYIFHVFSRILSGVLLHIHTHLRKQTEPCTK